MNVFAGPAHFRNVNQTFNTVFKLYKCAVIGNVGYFAFVNLADFVFAFDIGPGIGFKLFHTQTDALGVFVEFDNLNFNSLADRQNFCRMIDTAPRNIGNVQQTVNTAQINKCTVIGNIFDNTFQNGAFFKVMNQFGTGFGSGFLQNDAARNDDIAANLVHFQNLERLNNAHQRRNVADRTNINL